MQKLEEIMRAEEAARHLMANAKSKAADLRSGAEEKARRIAAEMVAETQTTAADITQRRLSEAQAEAGRIRGEVSQKLDAEIEAASTRIDVAVAAVVERLVG